MKRIKHGGRKKGVGNRIPRAVKDEFEHVFKELQNDPKANLWMWAKENATEFYRLCKVLIPQAIQHSGEVAHTHTPLTPEELTDRMDAIVRHRNKHLEIENGTI